MQAMIECTTSDCKLSAFMPLDRATKRAEEHADEKKHVVRMKDAKGKVSFVDGVAREVERKESNRKSSLESARRIATEKGASTLTIDERSLRLLFEEVKLEPKCAACKVRLEGKAAFGIRKDKETRVACSEECLLRLAYNLQWVAKTGGG